jgi:hypothetical protein
VGAESQPAILQQLSELLGSVCTSVCTSKSKTVHAELLETLAATLRDSLPLDDCRRLAAMLTEK